MADPKQPDWYSGEQPYPAPGGYPGPDAVYYPGHTGYPPVYYPPSPPTNGLAVAGMVVSILSIVVCMAGCPLPVGPVGAIMSHVARRQIRERGESGDGMALAGVIIGWISTALFLLAVAAVTAFFLLGVNGAFDDPQY